MLSIVYLALATRSLGIDGFGQFTLVLSTAQAVSAFVGFQTWQVVVRYGMGHVGAGRSDALGRLIRFCVALDIGGALLGLICVGAALSLMRAHFDWSPGFTLQAFGFSAILLLSIRSTAVGILRLHDRFAVGAGADAATPIMRCAGAIIAVWQEAGIAGFLFAWAMAEVTTAAVYWISAARAAPDMTDGWRGALAAPSENAGLWHFALVTNVNATLTAASRQFVVILVGLMTGAATAGSYRLAYQLSQSLVRLSDMFARGVFPEIARAHADDVALGLRTLVRQSTRLAVTAGLMTCMLVPLLGQPVLLLIAGEAYLGTYPLLVLLGIAAGFDIMASGFEPVLLGTGRAAQMLRIRAVATLVLIVSVLLLMPLWGAVGAGVASLMASMFTLALLARTATSGTRDAR